MTTHTNICPAHEQLSRAMAEGPDTVLLDHLGACADCSAAWDEMERVQNLVGQLPVAALDNVATNRVKDQLLAAIAEPATSDAGNEADDANAAEDEDRSHRRWVLYAAAAAILVAVTGAMLSLVVMDTAPEPPTYRAEVHAHGVVSYHRLGEAPDEIVRLMDGTMSFDVDELGPGERFRVVTQDGEVEVQGTVFEVTARDDRLVSVRVISGRVEVRPEGRPASVLDPGQRWSDEGPLRQAPVELESETGAAALGDDEVASDELDPEEESPQTAVEPNLAQPLAEAPVERDEEATTPTARAIRPTAAVAPTVETERPEEPTNDEAPKENDEAREPPTSKIDRLYGEGFEALSAKDYRTAVTRFDAVLNEPSSAVTGDARFWRAVALLRSRDARGHTALRQFIVLHPGSSRVGEAHTLLGWELLRTGQTGAAEKHFRAALNDKRPRVRDSAAAGLRKLEVTEAP